MNKQVSDRHEHASSTHKLSVVSETSYRKHVKYARSTSQHFISFYFVLIHFISGFYKNKIEIIKFKLKQRDKIDLNN